MDWRDRVMIPGRLRLRFVIASGLLVLTTVTASVWTFFALTRLSGIVTDTVQQSESVTAVTSRLAGALEREDDAVLLILAGDERGAQVLARGRAIVDQAVSDLFGVLGPDDERRLVNPLQEELRAYRQASDAVISVRPGTGSARAVPPASESGPPTRCCADDHHSRSALCVGSRSDCRCARPGRGGAACGSADHTRGAWHCRGGGLAPDTHGRRTAAAVDRGRQ